MGEESLWEEKAEGPWGIKGMMIRRIVEWSWKADSGYTLNCIKTWRWNFEF